MTLHLPRHALFGVIAFAVVSVVLFAFLLARFGGPSFRVEQPRLVSVELPNAQGVTAGADVLVRGVKVGRVGEVANAPGGARLELEIDEDTPLHADAVARVGGKTPLGEAFVALDVGRNGAAADEIQGRAAVQIDEFLGVLDAPAREDLQALLRTSAESLEPGGEQLGATVDGLSDLVARFRSLGATLRDQSADVATIVQSSRAVLRELGDNDAAIRGIVRDGRATLEAVAAQRPDLEAALDQLPGVVADARATLAAADPLLREARPFAGDLRSAAPPLSRSLVALRPALRDTRVLLDRVPALADAALPALDTIGKTLPSLSRTAAALSPALRNVVPMLDYLAPRANTVAAWFSNTDALGQNGDARGKWARFFVGFDPMSATGAPGAPPGNSYTQPGDAAANKAYEPGDFPRLLPYAPPDVSR